MKTKLPRNTDALGASAAAYNSAQRQEIMIQLLAEQNDLLRRPLDKDTTT